VSESKYTFFITIIVDDVPFIPKGTIDLWYLSKSMVNVTH
jgi:hypothetical protein